MKFSDYRNTGTVWLNYVESAGYSGKAASHQEQKNFNFLVTSQSSAEQRAEYSASQYQESRARCCAWPADHDPWTGAAAVAGRVVNGMMWFKGGGSTSWQPIALVPALPIHYANRKIKENQLKELLLDRTCQ
jgi:hypothetical protein